MKYHKLLMTMTLALNGESLAKKPNPPPMVSYVARAQVDESVPQRDVAAQTDAIVNVDTVYNGKKISLDFQDIEIRRVLQLLADFTGVNMVASDTVKGNISLHLKDVPWDQALELMLKSKGLAQRRFGNAIWIAPQAELNKSEEEEAKAVAHNGKTATLHSEYIALKYAKASDIEQLIIKSKFNVPHQTEQPTEKSQTGKKTTPFKHDSGGSLLSPRGSVTIDQRTNTLIVTDTAFQLDQIRKMIERLDVSVRQVMIEARVVRASTDFSKELGVKWGVLAQSTSPAQPTNQPRHSQQLNIDLGVSSVGASRLNFGLIHLTDLMLDLELSALQADGAAEVISTPKVMTADKQKASVAAGRQVPYQTRENSNGVSNTTTSFKDALLSLDVTPSITPDGRVQMQLSISSDSPGEIAPNGEFILNKNQINTNVLVKDGETVVLGGIFEQDSRNKKMQVPLLGNLPGIGGLFRRTEKMDKKSELLIFVTPRIVNDSLQINH